MQALKREFETISMKRNEKIDEYSDNFARIVTNLRDLGESLNDYGAGSRLLTSFPKYFYSLILLLKQTSDLKTMRLEEAFGKLKVHELRFQERNSRDEDQAFLSRAFNMSKKDQRGSSSSRRERRKKGKGKDHCGEANGEKKKKQFDTSNVKCYTCQKLVHFADQCEIPKKDKSKGKEKMHIAQEDE